MDQLLLLASLAEAWGPRGEALGARVPEERLSALLLYESFGHHPIECHMHVRPLQTKVPSYSRRPAK